MERREHGRLSGDGVMHRSARNISSCAMLTCTTNVARFYTRARVVYTLFNKSISIVNVLASLESGWRPISIAHSVTISYFFPPFSVSTFLLFFCFFFSFLFFPSSWSTRNDQDCGSTGGSGTRTTQVGRCLLLLISRVYTKLLSNQALHPKLKDKYGMRFKSSYMYSEERQTAWCN